jgi:hypothetical protein
MRTPSSDFGLRGFFVGDLGMIFLGVEDSSLGLRGSAR